MSACSTDKDAHVAIVPKRTQLLANPAVAGLVPMNDFATDEREAASEIRRLVGNGVGNGGGNGGTNVGHGAGTFASAPMQWPNL